MLNVIEQIGELVMVPIWLLGEFIEDHLTPAVDSCYSDNAGLDNPRKAGSFLGRNEGESQDAGRAPRVLLTKTARATLHYSKVGGERQVGGKTDEASTISHL